MGGKGDLQMEGREGGHEERSVEDSASDLGHEGYGFWARRRDALLHHASPTFCKPIHLMTQF